MSWMNERMQITDGLYGTNLSADYGHDAYGFPCSTVTGSIQNYQYYFNPVTSAPVWRKNVLQGSIQESFQYDLLDRLDRVYNGGNTLLEMSYADNGNITTKSDAGTLQYDLEDRPYTLSNIDPSNGLIPEFDQNIWYNSFESVDSISENNYVARFLYNEANERARMRLKHYDDVVLTRWYADGGSYMKETRGAVTKEYTYIGGDAYSAPVVAVKQGETITWYYLLRDYLGNITHQVNTSNSVVAEWSYDPWGRLRNPATLEYYAPGTEPQLFAGRGFTGHEHLPWFNLINMNGRLYDPLTGLFLSPDNYIQMPDYTQNLNRYLYALNNPLLFTDPAGELFDPITEFIHGFFKGIFSGRNPFKEGHNQVKNLYKIIGGLFAANTKQAGWGWQIVSRLTWESPQTALGYLFADLSNTFGNIESVLFQIFSAHHLFHCRLRIGNNNPFPFS